MAFPISITIFCTAFFCSWISYSLILLLSTSYGTGITHWKRKFHFVFYFISSSPSAFIIEMSPNVFLLNLASELSLPVLLSLVCMSLFLHYSLKVVLLETTVSGQLVPSLLWAQGILDHFFLVSVRKLFLSSAVPSVLQVGRLTSER